MTKREVTYCGATYKVRRDDVEIPDLHTMERIPALMWLVQNTYGKGRSNRRPNPLAGLGDAITVRTR